MIQIYVDADACPVKDEIVRVAARHQLNVTMVSDGGIRPNPHPLVATVIVDRGTDAADNWIAAHIDQGDIAVTNDIPLAARCIENGGTAIRPNGQVLDERSIGSVLATRNLMTDLRSAGEIMSHSNPFTKRDRSNFLDFIERTVQSAKLV